MKEEIQTRHKKGDIFEVEIQKDDAVYVYSVSFSETYRKELGVQDISKEKCIKASFLFLLDHEPVHAILSSFNLRVVEEYFPEYRKKFFKYLDMV